MNKDDIQDKLLKLQPFRTNHKNKQYTALEIKYNQTN